MCYVNSYNYYFALSCPAGGHRGAVLPPLTLPAWGDSVSPRRDGDVRRAATCSNSYWQWRKTSNEKHIRSWAEMRGVVIVCLPHNEPQTSGLCQWSWPGHEGSLDPGCHRPDQRSDCRRIPAAPGSRGDPVKKTKKLLSLDLVVFFGQINVSSVTAFKVT